MSETNTEIEYPDDLVLYAYEFRWLKGGKFALIGVIAICAAQDFPYANKRV